LSEEAAAVSRTKFMTPAAAVNPAMPKTVTKGLTPGTTLRHGTTHMMAAKAST
jgi:hypothetical protein